MTVYVPSSTTSSGDIITTTQLNPGDTLFVRSTVNLISTSNDVVDFGDGDFNAVVQGTMFGDEYGFNVLPTNGPAVDVNHRVDVTETGFVGAEKHAFWMGSGNNLNDGVGSMTIGNAGEITSLGQNGMFLLYLADCIVTNSGVIQSLSQDGAYNSAMTLYAIDNAHVLNTGLIKNVANGTTLANDSAISYYSGTKFAFLDNSGTISSGGLAIYSAATSGDDMANSGSIFGDINLSNAVSDFLNSGSIIGDINLNAGNDTYRVMGAGFASGTVNGGNGNDVIIGGNEADQFIGGNNNDVLRGSVGEDTLSGSTGADRIFGGADDDVINGGVGMDTIRGGTGDDLINGWTQADVLYGDGGADEFFYSNAAASTIGASDTIADFQRGLDVINLSNVTNGLTFIGGAGFSGAKEVRKVAGPGGEIRVLVDSDGNGAADMRIFVADVGNLSADDFIL